LRRIQPFAIAETMVPAAAPSRTALRAVERHIAESIARLLPQIDDFIGWVGHCPPPDVAQERFSLLRLRFNLFLDRFDVFADVITQRSEQPGGLWLAGLDALAEDMLTAGVRPESQPALACYLDRGRGAAIRRARTRFSDGEQNPLALIRLPRERMIGSGVGSSLAHEVGHQGVELLGLLEPLRKAIAERRFQGPWLLWASEILADFWAICCLGVSATVGLLAVVTLPQAFVFRLNEDDVHPTPYIRTLLSTALGERVFPDPQWRQLADAWRSLYPLASAPLRTQALLAKREAEIPKVADLITSLRFAPIDSELADHMMASARGPEQLRRLFGAGLKEATPLRALAALGQARADGVVPPETEARMLDQLLRRWALQRSGLVRAFRLSSQGENHVPI
jgi:hypothetical protein